MVTSAGSSIVANATLSQLGQFARVHGLSPHQAGTYIQNCMAEAIVVANACAKPLLRFSNTKTQYNQEACKSLTFSHQQSHLRTPHTSTAHIWDTHLVHSQLQHPFPLSSASSYMIKDVDTYIKDTVMQAAACTSQTAEK